MGLFSQACAATDICGGKDVMGPYAIDDESAWMNEAVAITPSGSILMGTYDGYGTVDGFHGAIGLDGNVVFHRACWELSGKPTDHDPDLVRGGDTFSVGADPDFRMSVQGHFVPDGYLIPDPRLAVTT